MSPTACLGGGGYSRRLRLIPHYELGRPEGPEPVLCCRCCCSSDLCGTLQPLLVPCRPTSSSLDDVRKVNGLQEATRASLRPAMSRVLAESDLDHLLRARMRSVRRRCEIGLSGPNGILGFRMRCLPLRSSKRPRSSPSQERHKSEHQRA